MSISYQEIASLKSQWASQAGVHQPIEFKEGLSPELFFAMAPNLSDEQFVCFSAPIFLGRAFNPAESFFYKSELASLRISRNECLSMLRYSEEGKSHSNFNSFTLKFWRLNRFILKVAHRIPKIGPKVCRVLELPRVLLTMSRLPRRLEEVEGELESIKHILNVGRNGT